MTHEQGYYAETRTLCCTVRYEARQGKFICTRADGLMSISYKPMKLPSLG